MTISVPFLLIYSLVVLSSGIALGFIIQNYISNKIIYSLSLQVADLKIGQQQLQADYDLLLEAMNGAKIQAENFQREILGTNIVEVQEHEDPEKVLNRHLLADYIYKKLEDNFSKSDQMDDDEIPGDPKVFEALEGLDDRVVDILAKAIK